MDPQQIAADLKKLTQHSDIFHKHAPMEGHYETVLAAAGQREPRRRSLGRGDSAARVGWQQGDQAAAGGGGGARPIHA